MVCYPEDPEPTECSRQNDLTERIDNAIISAIEEWDCTFADILGCLEIIKHDYLKRSDEQLD